MLKKDKTRMGVLVLLLGTLMFFPSLSGALTVSWFDDGTGNDGLWHPMDAFVFLAGDTGSFGIPPVVGQPGWTGQVVSGSTASAQGSGLTPGNFQITVDFTGIPPVNSYFDCFGYVGETPVEGIRMSLTSGNWCCPNYALLDLENAPPSPNAPVPEPAHVAAPRYRPGRPCRAQDEDK